MVNSGQDTALVVVDVVPIPEIVEVLGHCGCAIIMNNNAPPMFLECFYAPHVHRISEVAIVEVALDC